MTGKPATPSRRRLLDAATAEFAEHGIAGARVDRIAATAKVNKAQLYGWYGSKDGLFDAILEEHLQEIIDSVPLTGDDLPGYATRLYDAHLERPWLVRLATWFRLERTPTGALFTHPKHHDEDKYRPIAEAQADGLVDPDRSPEDIFALVTAISLAWSPASLVVVAGKQEDEGLHERRKEALAAAVRGAFCREPR